jgi:hypothetical protein
MRTEFWWGNLTDGDRLEDMCLDGRIILKWLLKEVGWEGVNRMRLRIGTRSGFLQTSIECGEFVDKRRNCVLRRARNHVVGWLV